MGDTKLTILVIDDSIDDRELYKRLLRKNTHIATILDANDVKQGLALYHTQHIDCALVDYKLFGDTGLDFIKKVHKLAPPFLPIIMLTGQGNEKIAVEAMKTGATDYLTKDTLTEQLLNSTIKHVIEKNKLITECNKKTKALEFMATTDSLTGLMNRRTFQMDAKKRLSDAKRQKYTCAILFIDLDDFKRINDTHGHKIGDRLLTLVSAGLLLCLREEDIVCRYGGDEFVVIAGRIQDNSNAPDIAKKIISLLSKRYTIDGITLQISASIGIAYSHPSKNIDLLIQEADLALYEAKRRGKGKYVVSTETFDTLSSSY